MKSWALGQKGRIPAIVRQVELLLKEGKIADVYEIAEREMALNRDRRRCRRPPSSYVATELCFGMSAILVGKDGSENIRWALQQDARLCESIHKRMAQLLSRWERGWQYQYHFVRIKAEIEQKSRTIVFCLYLGISAVTLFGDVLIGFDYADYRLFWLLLSVLALVGVDWCPVATIQAGANFLFLPLQLLRSNHE